MNTVEPEDIIKRSCKPVSKRDFQIAYRIYYAALSGMYFGERIERDENQKTAKTPQNDGIDAVIRWCIDEHHEPFPFVNRIILIETIADAIDFRSHIQKNSRNPNLIAVSEEMLTALSSATIIANQIMISFDYESIKKALEQTK